MAQQETKRTGDISVETAHIFPIIKKWLYSEKDIFLRELVSNAADAVTKHRRLISLGEIEGGDEAYRITITLDADGKTLTVSDNGVGMTEDELIRYLGNIALSGALEFINKYEGESEGEGNSAGIIGHFGLGFYSAFMVADTVEVVTRSYQDAPAVRWVCKADGSYELSPAEREERGTDVILHITTEEKGYLSSAKIKDMLEKYCSFMPTEIYFDDGTDEADDEDDDEDDDLDLDEAEDAADAADATEETADAADEDAAPKGPKPINDTTPLWQKRPSDCTDEEYKAFYRKVFRDYREPLFYIHINADYPLNFKGILYFPRRGSDAEPYDGQVKLYYNQVFVADNIKEVIPEYLFMLRGVLDCPELPLNVSRSYLQNNTYIRKVSAHIVKKITDKLNALCNTDRESYEGIWDSIRPYIEFACLHDRKFFDRAKESLLFKLTSGSYVTIEEYLSAAKTSPEDAEAPASDSSAEETTGGTIYYTSDPEAQAQYVALFEAQNLQVAIMDHMIDSQFVQMYEQYETASGIHFLRIDSNVADVLAHDDEVAENEALVALYRKVSGNDKLTVNFAALKDKKTPAVLTVSEESRRLEEMMQMYAGQTGTAAPIFPVEYTLTVNTSAALNERIAALAESDADMAEAMAAQIWRLCLLSHRKLTAEELNDLLAGTYDLLSKL